MKHANFVWTIPSSMFAFFNNYKLFISVLAASAIFFVDSASAQSNEEHVLRLNQGKVHFVSDAPLELIEATSTEIQAVIDTVSGKFAFAIPMTSFLGFNSELQRTHFNENYLESAEYPRSTFTGKMIESWETAGENAREVRAKGKLTIHGESVERLIPAVITKDGDRIFVHAEFIVPVSDHKIHIPRLVGQKIASEITVEIDAWFE